MLSYPILSVILSSMTRDASYGEKMAPEFPLILLGLSFVSSGAKRSRRTFILQSWQKGGKPQTSITHKQAHHNQAHHRAGTKSLLNFRRLADLLTRHFADNSPLPSHNGNREEKTMLDRAPIKEPIKTHLKIVRGQLFHNGLRQKISPPSPPKFL
jgi:hypothetical protein